MAKEYAIFCRVVQAADVILNPPPALMEEWQKTLQSSAALVEQWRKTLQPTAALMTEWQKALRSSAALMEQWQKSFAVQMNELQKPPRG